MTYASKRSNVRISEGFAPCTGSEAGSECVTVHGRASIDRLLPRRVATLAALATAACLVAGCGGGGGSRDAAGTAATETITTTAPATTVPAKTTTAGPKTITIVVKNAVPVGGIERATVAKGDKVVLVVRSDVADEVHLHGYNLSTDVRAGGVGRIAFVAQVPGRFEVELEQRGVKIADLTVAQ